MCWLNIICIDLMQLEQNKIPVQYKTTMEDPHVWGIHSKLSPV